MKKPAEPPMVAAGAQVIWQATPTVWAVAREVLLSVSIAAVFVAVIMVVPHADPSTAWLAVVAPVITSVRGIISLARGRVVLAEDSIEVRRVRTRQYPRASLSSITIDDDGYLEITPDGWVRRLPIPRSEVAVAYDLITRWWNRSSSPSAAAPVSGPAPPDGTIGQVSTAHGQG